MSPGEFAAWSCSRAGVVYVAGSPEQFSALRPTLTQLRELEHHAHAYKNGVELSANFEHALEFGATVYFKNVGRRLPELETVVEDVRVATRARYWEAAIVCCASDEPGFKAHQDAHDLVVLQLTGTKTWTVFANQRMSEVAFCRDLSQGDMLYVPQNWWHFVRPSGQSMHVTISLGQ